MADLTFSKLGKKKRELYTRDGKNFLLPEDEAKRLAAKNEQPQINAEAAQKAQAEAERLKRIQELKTKPEVYQTPVEPIQPQQVTSPIKQEEQIKSKEGTAANIVGKVGAFISGESQASIENRTAPPINARSATAAVATGLGIGALGYSASVGGEVLTAQTGKELVKKAVGKAGVLTKIVKSPWTKFAIGGSVGSILTSQLSNVDQANSAVKSSMELIKTEVLNGGDVTDAYNQLDALDATTSDLYSKIHGFNLTHLINFLKGGIDTEMNVNNTIKSLATLRRDIPQLAQQGFAKKQAEYQSQIQSQAELKSLQQQ